MGDVSDDREDMFISLRATDGKSNYYFPISHLSVFDLVKGSHTLFFCPPFAVLVLLSPQPCVSQSAPSSHLCLGKVCLVVRSVCLCLVCLFLAVTVERFVSWTLDLRIFWSYRSTFCAWVLHFACGRMSPLQAIQIQMTTFLLAILARLTSRKIACKLNATFFLTTRASRQQAWAAKYRDNLCDRRDNNRRQWWSLLSVAVTSQGSRTRSRGGKESGGLSWSRSFNGEHLKCDGDKRRKKKRRTRRRMTALLRAETSL